MIYDIFVILIILGWSIARVLQKSLLKDASSTDYTKWVIIISGVLVLPLAPFVTFSGWAIMSGVFLSGLLWMFELFSKFFAIKKDEVSRLSAFLHFKFLFAMLLTMVFLGETATINTILGGFLMLVGGVIIAVEKSYKQLKVSNVALMFFLFAMMISGFGYFLRQFLLQKTDPFSILFFGTIFAALVILPTVKKRLDNTTMKLAVVIQLLMTGGFFSLLWILSKQELVNTVPLFGLQPLIILLLSKQLLKESEHHFFSRFIALLIIIGGYLILRGFLL